MTKEIPLINIVKAAEKFPIRPGNPNSWLYPSQEYVDFTPDAQSYQVQIQTPSLINSPDSAKIMVNRKDPKEPEEGFQHGFLKISLMVDPEGNIQGLAKEDAFCFYCPTPEGFQRMDYYADSEDPSVAVLQRIVVQDVDQVGVRLAMNGMVINPEEISARAKVVEVPEKIDWLETVRMYLEGKILNEGEEIPLTANFISQTPLIAIKEKRP